MNNKKIYRPVIAATLSVIMVTGSVMPVFAADDTKKEENVYVNLQNDGSVDGVYVVNSYDLKKDQKITDYGDYSSVKNLSSDRSLKENGDKITVDAKKGKFYYQGNLDSASIPWTIDLTYELNGEEISPDDLAGKSGRLKIHLNIRKNEHADQDFFKNFLLQISVTLNTKHCKNIKTKGATEANSGDDKKVMYNIMAGQEKNLVIETEVKDFEMDPISISGVPMSFDIDSSQLDTGKLTDKTKKLKSGVSSLKEGANQVNEGSKAMKSGLLAYGQGVDAGYKGADTLFAGLSQLNLGVASYTNGVDQVASGAKQLEQKTQNLPILMGQMTSAVNQLKNGSSNLSNPSAWKQIEQGFSQMKSGLSKMKEGLQKMDSQGLAPMKVALSDGGQLKNGVENLETGISAAKMYSEKLNSVSSAYDQQTQTLGKIISNQKSTVVGSRTVKDGQTTKDTQKEEGTYTKDHTETKRETSTDENGNTVITVTNDIYMTKTDTVTNTVTKTKEVTESSKVEKTAELQSLYGSMKTNAAIFHAILDGNGSNPGLSTILTKLGSGTSQLKSDLYEGNSSMRAYLEILQKQMTGKGGLTDGVDTMMSGLSKLETSICGNQEKSVKNGISALDQGIGTLKTSTNSIPGQMNQLQNAIAQLSSGTSQLSKKSSNLTDGTKQLVYGASSLKNGSQTLASKTSSLNEGAQKLTDGTGKLYEGTKTFSNQTGNIDEQILDGIDQEISKLSGKDYKVKSFVSSKNKKISVVQFVMKTKGIEKKKETKKKETKKKETILDKLKNLF